MKTHQEIDERSLALARAIAEKVDADPAHEGVARAREICARWMRLNPNPYLLQWRRILEDEWPKIRKVLLDTSETGKALRQCSPFCGILTPRERWGVYRRFRSLHDS